MRTINLNVAYSKHNKAPAIDLRAKAALHVIEMPNKTCGSAEPLLNVIKIFCIIECVPSVCVLLGGETKICCRDGIFFIMYYFLCFFFFIVAHLFLRKHIFESLKLKLRL